MILRIEERYRINQKRTSVGLRRLQFSRKNAPDETNIERRRWRANWDLSQGRASAPVRHHPWGLSTIRQKKKKNKRKTNGKRISYQTASWKAAIGVMVDWTEEKWTSQLNTVAGVLTHMYLSAYVLTACGFGQRVARASEVYWIIDVNCLWITSNYSQWR